MATRSDQQIALGRRPARISRIGRLRIASEVRQYPFNDGRILDAGDDLELPAAAPAGLDVDREHPFEPLCPGQRPLPVGVRWLAALLGLGANDATGPGHNPGPIRARRREHTTVAGQVRSAYGVNTEMTVSWWILTPDLRAKSISSRILCL